MIDMEDIEKIISGNVLQLEKYEDNYNFNIKVKYKKYNGLKQLYPFLPGEKIIINLEKYLKAIFTNPSTEEESLNVYIHFVIRNFTQFPYKRYNYFPINLNNGMYSIIPFEFDDNDINIIFCGNEENAKSLANCKKSSEKYDKIVNIQKHSYEYGSLLFPFGIVLNGIKRQKFFYLINENDSPIDISKIKTDNLHITLNVENY